MPRYLLLTPARMYFNIELPQVSTLLCKLHLLGTQKNVIENYVNIWAALLAKNPTCVCLTLCLNRVCYSEIYNKGSS